MTLPSLSALTLFGLALASPAPAQTRLSFGSTLEMIRVGVTATRGRDMFVTSLGAPDFRVLEDGVPQEITLFSRQSAPVSLVLLLDVSASMKERLPQVQEAATGFVRALASEDEVQVAQFKDRVTVLQDFTRDRRALEAAIHRTEAVGATALNNALYISIRTLRNRARPGELRRRAVVVLSDGDDNASVVGEDQVLDFARRSDVSIYAIGLDAGPGHEKETGQAVQLLTALTRETGGTLLRPGSVKDLEGVYGRIAEELRTQYTLGYVSSNPARNGKWRKIRVEPTRRKALKLRYRLGYYAGGASPTAVALPLPPTAEEARPASADRGVPKAAEAVPEPASAAEDATEAGPEWMDVAGDVLSLALVHLDDGGAGVLRVDTGSRLLSWQPASEVCSHHLEVPFDAVTAVTAAAGGGIRVEARAEKPTSLTFVPAPYAAWFRPDRRGEPTPGSLRVETRTAVTSLLDALGRAPSPGQVALEAFYGTPVAVSLRDLLASPGSFEGRAVRVRGALEVVSREQGRYRLHSAQSVAVSEDLEYTLSLSPAEDHVIQVAPVRQLAAYVSSQAKAWDGETVELTGVFRRRSETSDDETAPFAVRFWDVGAPKTAGSGASVVGRPVTLEDLLAAGRALDGALVRVVGRFRGANLFGDLPTGTRRKSSDWVLKDGASAVWVTGKGPSGSGWSLDIQSARDSVNWLEVVGRPRTRHGTVYLHAMDVIPTSAPPGVSEPPRTIVKVYGPPVITFALPEDGDRVVPATQFVIQFSNPMDPGSLQGKVELGYAGARKGDHPFGRLRVVYSDQTRSIVIVPGSPLEPGRQVECRLLNGIRDSGGRPLAPRNGHAAGPTRSGEQPVEILHFKVGG